MSIPGVRKNDKRLSAFVEEATATLLEGKRYQTPGLGTFSTCTRKATKDKPACKIAMFRACDELREYSDGGPPPSVSGPHADIVKAIIGAMKNKDEVEIPRFGCLAIVHEPGKKKAKLVFQGAKELNNALAESL